MYVCMWVFSDSEADDASDSPVQCTVITDATSASCEAEARRDSGISIASSLVTTTCMSEPPVLLQQAAIVEEPSCDLSDEASQPVTGTDDAALPAVLSWISLPTDQGYSSCFLSMSYWGRFGN